jgi:ferredoxin-type protein NapG
MGQAKVNAGMCYLSQDRPCSVCIERCPIGQNAIRLGSSGAVDILETGCVGCGVCQHHCPAIPKAIVVSPSP